VVIRGRKLSLVVIPNLPLTVRADGSFLVTKKFVEGMAFYAKAWDGSVVALMPVVDEASDNLDSVVVDPATLPFTIEVMRSRSRADVVEAVRGAGVVMGGPFHWLRDVSSLCAEANVPSVYNTEYSLTTRLQIVLANSRNPLRVARRSLWEVSEELMHYRRELSAADGVQCNGTPTYDAYKDLTPDPLLYFDTRVFESEVASDQELERANARRLQGRPLQLAFSGRLNATKGAGDLIKVASELDRLKVPFALSIFGAGSLEQEMRLQVQRRGLADRVILPGVLDFHSRLLPTLRDNVDLFVCCHPQGDPSCTYLETMSAGVPIVGYANAAFAGLVGGRDIGWTVPLGDVHRMAEQIALLSRQREMLVDGASAALAFARQHTFERTFRRRVDHLGSIAARGRRSVPLPTLKQERASL
jgi:glycosyltransferase involved in cell wall biosynthesis